MTLSIVAGIAWDAHASSRRGQGIQPGSVHSCGKLWLPYLTPAATL